MKENWNGKFSLESWRHTFVDIGNFQGIHAVKPFPKFFRSFLYGWGFGMRMIFTIPSYCGFHSIRGTWLCGVKDNWDCIWRPIAHLMGRYFLIYIWSADDHYRGILVLSAVLKGANWFAHEITTLNKPLCWQVDHSKMLLLSKSPLVIGKRDRG